MSSQDISSAPASTVTPFVKLKVQHCSEEPTGTSPSSTVIQILILAGDPFGGVPESVAVPLPLSVKTSHPGKIGDEESVKLKSAPTLSLSAAVILYVYNAPSAPVIIGALVKYGLSFICVIFILKVDDTGASPSVTSKLKASTKKISVPSFV